MRSSSLATPGCKFRWVGNVRDKSTGKWVFHRFLHVPAIFHTDSIKGEVRTPGYCHMKESGGTGLGAK